MSAPKKIPLHDFHARHGARFVDFGGWDMPVQYSSILDEHRAVREAAGLFDVSHMGEFLVTGEGAAGFLDHLLTNRISSAAPGRAVYSPICQESGGVVDDLIVYRLTEDRFLLCVNAGNIEADWRWIHQQAAEWPDSLELSDCSADYCLLALQGPRAVPILEQAGLGIAAEIGRFRHAVASFGGHEIRLCRTGYTGEDGFEIYLAPEAAEAMAEALLAAGRDSGMRLCGLGARDSLRLEAGLPLYGHELSEQISPVEAGLDWTVKLDKPDFIGKRTLQTQMREGPARRVVFFRLPGRRIARAGTAVIDAGGQPVGQVCSGTLSPLTDSPIGSALIASETDPKELRVDLRGHAIKLDVDRPPLHRPSGAS